MSTTYYKVIMIQIENEIGMLEDARDYSKEADKLFYAPVPSLFIDYLQKNKRSLHPEMLAKWESQGFKKKGTWQEVFGADVYTDEIFMAWSYAQYVERMAKLARSIYNIPLYVNAAMNSRGRKPGEYPSAGPLAHLIDVWHYAAPNIDFLAPDLYDKGFVDWVAKYKLHNNPLFIPEIRLEDNDGVRAFYVFGEHDAIGFCPFSIESGSDRADAPLVQSYIKLKELMPLLTKYQGKGVMNGLLFDEENKERILSYDDLEITCRHYFTLPWDPRARDGTVWPEGGGVLLRLAPDEYIVAGSGLVLEFKKQGENKMTVTGVAEDDSKKVYNINVVVMPEYKGKLPSISGVETVTEAETETVEETESTTESVSATETDETASENTKKSGIPVAVLIITAFVMLAAGYGICYALMTRGNKKSI